MFYCLYKIVGTDSEGKISKKNGREIESVRNANSKTLKVTISKLKPTAMFCSLIKDSFRYIYIYIYSYILERGETDV